MFGTIGRMQFKDAKMRSHEQMMRFHEEWHRTVRPHVKGAMFNATGHSVDRPDELLLIALAQDEATYRSIPGLPQQEAWYQRISQYLKTEPTWEDIDVDIVAAEGLKPALSESSQTSSFQADDFRKAVESSDLEKLASFFADDAEYELIDRRHPPKQSLKVHGRSGIAKELMSRESDGLRHKVDHLIQHGDSVAYRETCTYPNGDTVSLMSMMTLQNGKIARDVTMQEWDG